MSEDTFDQADFYTCEKEAESFEFETPLGALRDADFWAEEGNAPSRVTVYAHKKKEVTEEDLHSWTLALCEAMTELFDEEHGYHSKRDGALEAIMRSAVEASVDIFTVWNCEPAGERTYRRAEDGWEPVQ